MVTIRPAAPADLTRLGELGALLVRLHHSFDPDRFIAATEQTERGYGRFLVGQAGREDAFVLVAEDAGDVVGYIYAGVEGKDWMALRDSAGVVYDLVVGPSHRRKGIGRLLLEEALTRLEGLGAPRFLLSTAAGNQAAQRMFAAMGFRPTMIEMTRELPAKD
jgi:ribosomal protein S18 acetylase RimI-like enzyme